MCGKHRAYAIFAYLETPGILWQNTQKHAFLASFQAVILCKTQKQRF
jgi:hypothetical protein